MYFNRREFLIASGTLLFTSSSFAGTLKTPWRSTGTFYPNRELNNLDNNLVNTGQQGLDTEGFELSVLKGAKEKIKNIKYIYFEHHFDDMLIKKYTLSDIHDYLIKNGFEKKFKVKMFFRKSFEYIYENMAI